MRPITCTETFDFLKQGGERAGLEPCRKDHCDLRGANYWEEYYLLEPGETWFFDISKGWHYHKFGITPPGYRVLSGKGEIFPGYPVLIGVVVPAWAQFSPPDWG